MYYYLGIIVFCILLIYLVICAYIKIKFAFWSSQPVFHIYDFWYFIRPPGQISYVPPAISKYVNLVNISTTKFEDINDTSITQVCNFIRTHYLQTKYATYLPSKSNIVGYLEGSNYPSYVSIYKKPKMLFDIKNSENPSMYIDDYISVMTARILHLSIKGVPTRPLYYIDHLCVNPANRKKGIAPEMIATTYYNISRYQRKVNTYLFKKEGDLNAIVPLTTYITYAYDILQSFPFIQFSNGSFSLIEITKKNISLFTHFIFQHNKFTCVIVPEISNMYSLLKSENMYVYGIIQNKTELVSVYIFKKNSLWFENNTVQIIDCIASLSNEFLMPEIFIIGFTQALHQIYKRDNTIRRIAIENISHNSKIISGVSSSTSTRNILYQYPSAFFLYNYACYSHSSNECFIVY